MSRYAEVYSATFQIQAQFSGLRYLMHYYPITAAIFGISLNMFILATIFILSWYRFFAKPLIEEDGYDDNYRDPFEEDDIGKDSGMSGDLLKEDSEEDFQMEDESSLLGENIEKVEQDVLKKDL